MQAHKFKPVVKDQLFYSKHKYCMSFYLAEVSALKTLDHAYIDVVLDRRKLWREVAVQRWGGTVPGAVKSRQTIVTKRWRDITDETSLNLHELADLLIKTSIDYKFVTSVNHAYVYTSSLTLIKKLEGLANLTDIKYTEAVVNRPKGTVKLKKPKHQYRSYLKSTKLSPLQKENLVNFFDNQKDHLRISPALQGWLIGPFHRCQEYFFIDYDSESWLVMLSLVTPGIVRKTVDIIPA
jgi:hypothetical protein